jgi:hypothetical protein
MIFKLFISLIDCEDVDWIHWTHDMVHWQAPVDTVIDLQVPKIARNFLTSWATIIVDVFVDKSFCFHMNSSNPEEVG